MSLSFTAVSKEFSGVHALKNLTLTVQEGTLTTVLGPSGCGKTTLLRIAAGLETATAGQVHIDGAPAALGRSAVVFQEVPLYPHLSVAENVGFPLSLRGASWGSDGGASPGILQRPFRRTADSTADRTAGRAGAAERAHRVAEALQLLRIEELGDRRPHELSGGQRQRVGIARALVRQTPVCLFDEPLAHLDEGLAREIRADVRRIQAQRGLTGLFVTHDQEEALAIGDRVAVMRAGELIQQGPPEQIWSAPAHRFVADFVGTAPMSFIDAADGTSWGFRPEEAQVLAASEEATGSGSEASPWQRRGQAPMRASSWTAAQELYGEVREQTYLGGRRLLEVQVLEGPGAGQSVRAMVDASGLGAEGVDGASAVPGARVRIRIPGEAIHRFDAEGARIA